MSILAEKNPYSTSFSAWKWSYTFCAAGRVIEGAAASSSTVGFPDRRHRTEIPQQRRCPGRANPRNGGQFGGKGFFLPFLAVVSDGKPVYLLLDSRRQRKGPAVGMDGNFLPLAGDGAGAVLVVLHHAEQRDRKPHGFQYRPDCRHMAFAAVEQNEIRKLGKPSVSPFSLREKYSPNRRLMTSRMEP